MSLESMVEAAVQSAPIFDIHTHLFPLACGDIAKWGIDDLVTYHYLEAEFFRFGRLTPEEYHRLAREQKADVIWDTLFVRKCPISEACRGVISVLTALGLPVDAPDLREARSYFAGIDPKAHVANVFRLANLSGVVMTNDPFDPAEEPLWRSGWPHDTRFRTALRIDPLLNLWQQQGMPHLQRAGYKVDEALSEPAIAEVRRFLAEWIGRMKPLYMAVSLPDTFAFPEDSARGRLIEKAVLPTCEEFGLPMALMIGVRKGMNPALRLAGDGVGRADLRAVTNLCGGAPAVRFLVTVLSMENQHELCICARKYPNLLPFGCWWFCNNPSMIRTITQQRLETLGATFIPQHSDARILEQLIYKWKHFRQIFTEVLGAHYAQLAASGRTPTEVEIRRDVESMLGASLLPHG